MKNNKIERLDKYFKLLFKEALNNNVFSGASVGIFKREGGCRKKFIKTFGNTRNDEKKMPINEKTLFDLASLTKPICTTLCILCLIDRGKLSLNDKLANLLKGEISVEKENIQINQLLSHSSGLKAYRPFFEDFKAVQKKNNKEQLIKKIFTEPMNDHPGTASLYSDLGFIVLGDIIEQTTGLGLNTFFEKNITEPLNLENQIIFKPLSHKSKNTNLNIAATEHCPWRGKILQGEVHDEHSWLMGGVAGHAGLFGTVSGVLTLCEHLLNQWQGRENHPAYANRLLQEALKKKSSTRTWCMGFDTPSTEGSSGGKYLSPRSAGHLGYTGTSFWIDPKKELIMVLLTNRVYFGRNNEKIRKFRPIFHDTVIEALSDE